MTGVTDYLFQMIKLF